MPTDTRAATRWRLRPSLIDIYVLGEVAGPFLGACVFFLFILIMFQLLRLGELLIIHGVAPSILLKMLGLISLSLVPLVIPVAFLISVLIGFGRLSGDSELIAMKANGMSLPRLAMPVLVFAVVVSVASVFLNLEWVPWGSREYKNTLIKVMNTTAVTSIKEGTFSGFYDLLVFADKVDPKTNHLGKVFIYDEREAKNPMTVVAATGDIIPVRTESEFGAAAVLKLNNGSINRNDIEGQTYQKIQFGEYRLYLKIDEGSGDSSEKPEMIPYRVLMDTIHKSDLSTYQGREYRGELSRRLGAAFSPLIFVFLGIGFGTVRTRAVRAGAVMTALVILAVYWGIQTYASTTVHIGSLPPYFAMQLPNIATLVAAVYSFRKSMW